MNSHRHKFLLDAHGFVLTTLAAKRTRRRDRSRRPALLLFDSACALVKVVRAAPSPDLQHAGRAANLQSRFDSTGVPPQRLRALPACGFAGSAAGEGTVLTPLGPACR